MRKNPAFQLMSLTSPLTIASTPKDSHIYSNLGNWKNGHGAANLHIHTRNWIR